ncbi:hypothetical protein [Sediminibacterium sp.]|uniref:hypothetical protein n=1 Tax=Sediminibacterium sp. TaxID=1917865 RepID=UPI0027303018|nr:hypothetical protein [Sediminibacterium sp.]MDP2421455.1 hypothetical protein [Sediminibacterium sp.]
MKTVMVILIALISSVRMCAQVQELQQLKLDLEKLAQFKLILSQMKSGYQVLQNGYNGIRDIGKSNFNLHQDYLEGLLLVSPSVKNNPAVNRVYNTQTQIIIDSKSLLSDLRKSQVFTVSELNEVTLACKNITDVVGVDAELLLSVLTPGKFRMSDGERTEVMGTMEQSVQKQAAKLKGLSDEYLKLMMLRRQNRRDMESLKGLSKQ